MLKPIAAALHIMLIATALTACTNNSDAEIQPARKGQITIGFSQIGESSRWRAANTRSIQDAARIQNVRLIFSVAGLSQQKQISDIQSFILQKVDVIAFSPVVEAGWDDVLRAAKAAKIPVILTDRAIRTEDPSLFTSSLGSDFISEGISAAVWTKNEFRKAPGPVNVVELSGTPGSAPAIQRRAGFLEGIDGDTKFKIISSRTANFSRADGKRVMAELLRSHDDIDVVFAQNDDMGLGAVTAIEEAGKRPGKDIKIATIDAIHDGLVALSNGKINFIAECNPLVGPQLMELIQDVFLGIPVPKRVDTRETVFFRENVDQYINDRKY
ncbi:ABC transporter substrate-binding protein [Paractinoplanes toevensis]|uniref:LacI family transcriptional regulator n=1 Tax=Paractinoplanes toevensis TaxID=571911 RepID=A0A919W868_9ACTN|nr:ABC transporter substrate-binding protein [Actinoplanes toevensis]GIM92286.1 LacI family transcriptional regulator [Actinoplanes toevensis]